MEYWRYLILALLIFMIVLLKVTSKAISSEISPETNKACACVAFLSNSSFTKSCNFEKIFLDGKPVEDNKPETVLCLGLFEKSMKWCLRDSQNSQLPVIANSTQFDSYVSQYESLDSIKQFCTKSKSLLDINQKYLKEFFSDAFTCSQYCMDPTSENKKPRKECSALAWFENILNSALTLSIPSDSKHEIDKKTLLKAPEAQTASEQNTKVKAEEKILGNQTLAISSSGESELESAKGKDNVSKIQSISSTLEQQTETLPESEANNEKISANQNIPDTKNVNENEQISNKVNQSSIAITSVNQKEIAINNTESKPDINKQPEVSVSKDDKKTEPSTGKTENSQKSEETKSSILSDNTNDIIDNPEGAHEELEIPPVSNNEEDQTGDISNLPNQAEIAVERKITTHFHSNATEEESHIFSYFVVVSLLIVCFYIGYHNKKKILAILLEGRRSRNGRGRRRPSTANYRKLDSNLEEAVTSQCNSNVTHVIY